MTIKVQITPTYVTVNTMILLFLAPMELQ